MIIKVCGMRYGENIKDVEALGVDWMGFIFFKDSPRHIDTIPSYLPSKGKRVGVFVNASISDITKKIQSFSLDMVQLHGNESPEFCHQLKVEANHYRHIELIKMFPIATPNDFETVNCYSRDIDYALFETKTKAKNKSYYGGSGKSFDWHILSFYKGKTPFLLTGGIGPDDAERIYTLDNPLFVGIDLNSRFEEKPGLKNVQSLQYFIKKIRLYKAQ